MQEIILKDRRNILFYPLFESCFTDGNLLVVMYIRAMNSIKSMKFTQQSINVYDFVATGISLSLILCPILK